MVKTKSKIKLVILRLWCGLADHSTMPAIDPNELLSCAQKNNSAAIQALIDKGVNPRRVSSHLLVMRTDRW